MVSLELRGDEKWHCCRHPQQNIFVWIIKYRITSEAAAKEEEEEEEA